MSKNNLADLNDRLFEMIEELGENGISSKRLDSLVRKADALSKLSSQVLKVANLQLRAIQMIEKDKVSNDEMPALVAVKDSRRMISDGVAQHLALAGVAR